MKTYTLVSLLSANVLLAGESSPVPSSSSKSGLPEYSAKGAKDVIDLSAPRVSPWRFGAGVMWRRLGATTVDPNLENGANSSDFSLLPTGTGAVGVPADRAYDDGFNNQGAGTPATGFTSNWGHQNDAQVDLNNPAGGSITFTKAGGRAFDFPGRGRDGDDTYTSPYLELAYLKPVRDRLEAGFVLNFSYTGLDSEINRPITEYAVSTRDTFPLQGVVPPLAPYNGNNDGPGPLITNILSPSDREQIFTAVGTGNYLFESETDLFSLALGGELNYYPTERIYLGLSGGLVVNYVNWDAAFSLPTTAGTLRGKNDGDDVLFGAYVKVSAGYQFNESWGVETFFRYDWTESLEGSIGVSDFETDLSGWSFGTGISYRF